MAHNELEELDIAEMSGVDAPANGNPGWMVMKSADQVAAVAEGQLASLYVSLGNATSLEGAPRGVRKAAKKIFDYVEKQLDSDDEDGTLVAKMKDNFSRLEAAEVETPDLAEVAKAKRKPKADEDEDNDDDDEGDEDVSKAEDDQLVETLTKALTPIVEEIEGLQDVVSRTLDRVNEVEGRMAGSAQPAGQDTQDVEKAAPTLLDGITSALQGNRVTIQ